MHRSRLLRLLPGLQLNGSKASAWSGRSPKSQVVNKGRTSLDDLRSNPTTPEVPQFGFNTNFHFDQFPILRGTLDTLLPVGGAMVPPGNHPYAAFSDDSPWQIT